MTPATNIADLLNTRLPADLLAFAKMAGDAAKANNTRAVLVGGAVRDLLLGREVVDADFMMEAPVAPVAQTLARLTKAKLTSHAAFQTFSLAIPGGRKIDIVTAREESYPTPAVLPKVKASTIEQDLRRRDFTINALTARLDDAFGEVLDPFNGAADLAAKAIRVLHDNSFVDDPTRIFRAARFAGRLGFRVELKTRGAIDAAIRAKIPEKLSAVRRRHEFELMLREPAPTAAFILLKEWDALRLLHPDWRTADPRAFGLDAVKQVEGGPPLLVARLARWFKWWGPQRALKMMTDLSFERATKRTVAEALGSR